MGKTRRDNLSLNVGSKHDAMYDCAFLNRSFPLSRNITPAPNFPLEPQTRRWKLKLDFNKKFVANSKVFYSNC